MNFRKIISIETFLLLIIPFIYLISWQSHILSTFLALSLIIIVFVIYHKPIDIIFFILGIILGSIGEISCVYFGVWEYNNPLFLGIPLWLSLFWGYVFILINRLALKLIIKKEITNKSFNIKLLPFIYLLLIITPSLLKSNIAVFLGLLIINIVLLYKADNRDHFFAISFAFFGPVLEILCVYYGLWKYTKPDVLGIPIWLILLYSGFALFIKKTADSFTQAIEVKT